jgi:hypothetical protein
VLLVLVGLSRPPWEKSRTFLEVFTPKWSIFGLFARLEDQFYLRIVLCGGKQAFMLPKALSPPQGSTIHRR